MNDTIAISLAQTDVYCYEKNLPSKRILWQKEDHRIRGSKSTAERYKISMTSSFMSHKL